MKYTVSVCNVGVVYSGNNKQIAQRFYDDYKSQSRRRIGFASGQQVTLLRSGVVVEQYNPEH